MPGDIHVLTNCLAEVKAVTDSRDANKYRVFRAMLDAWHGNLATIQSSNHSTGLIVQFLSMALILNHDDLKHLYYHDFIADLNAKLKANNIQLDDTTMTAQHPEMIEIRYNVGQKEERSHMIDVIRDGMNKWHTGDDSNEDPFDVMEKNGESNTTTSPLVVTRGAQKYRALVNENKRLLGIIGELRRAIAGLRPDPVPELTSGGCGKIEYIRSIVEPLRNYLTIMDPANTPQGAARNASFNYPPDWSRVKRSRASEYDPLPATGPTASLFRTHQRR